MPATTTTRWTAFCALPESPRGCYDEEIDVVASNRNRARKTAEAAIARDYDPRLRVRRVVPAGRVLVISNR